MAKDDKKTKARESRQAINSMDEDEKDMELEAEMLAQRSVDTRLIPPDLTLDAAFVAQVPFIVW
jgi:hypothetical protein